MTKRSCTVLGEPRPFRPSWLSLLTTPRLLAPWVFDRVTITEHGQPVVSVLSPVFSKYPSGPPGFLLADAAAEILDRRGYFGLASCRPLGFRAETGHSPYGRPTVILPDQVEADGRRIRRAGY